MRWAPDRYDPAVSGPVTPRLSSWLGGQLLADWIPISSGSLSVDADGSVPERLTVTVPAVDVQESRTRRWIPTRPDHPLEAFGQRLRLVLSRGVDGTPVGIGWYRITNWEDDDGDTVDVTASGLLAVVDRAKLLAPFTPTGTCGSVLPVVVDGLLPVQADGDLVDHNIGTAFAWTDDRLGALQDVLTAWPAQSRVDADGVLRIIRPKTAEDLPDGTFVDGEDGTVIRRATGGDSTGVLNSVHVTGSAAEGATDAEPPSGWWTDRDTGSPSRYDGPFGPAVAHLDNPACATDGDCIAAARQVVLDSRRHLQPITVDAVPDWRVEAWDRRNVQLADGSVVPGVILGYTLPITVADSSGGEEGKATYLVGRL